MKYSRVLLLATVFSFFLVACGSGEDFDTLKKRPVTQLNCSQLKFMAKKYESICDSSKRAAETSSTAVRDAMYLTAMQACNKASEYYGEVARRCY